MSTEPKSINLIVSSVRHISRQCKKIRQMSREGHGAEAQTLPSCPFKGAARRDASKRGGPKALDRLRSVTLHRGGRGERGAWCASRELGESKRRGCLARRAAHPQTFPRPGGGFARRCIRHAPGTHWRARPSWPLRSWERGCSRSLQA